MATRPYRSAGRTTRSEETRQRIRSAVHELLAEGAFHTSTVEEVAERAGISRATLYQHFRSRPELVDAVCETFDENPALVRLRETVRLEDAAAGLDETLAESIRFWSSEDPILRQLYGVAAVDPAADALVTRQRADRRRELEQLVRNLQRARMLRTGLGRDRALSLLLVLTSYDTFRELREAGLTDRQVTALLQESARELLLIVKAP